MQIRVIVAYQGWKSREQVIHPGVYEVGDPALYGAEDYLVNVQGKAVYLEDETLPLEMPEPTAVEPEPVEVDEIEHQGRKIKRDKPGRE